MEAENKPQVPWWQPGMQLFLKLSSWIGVPVIIGVVVGKFLDHKFGTTPWFFLMTVGTAFIISMIALVVIGLREMNKIENESQKSKGKSQNLK